MRVSVDCLPPMSRRQDRLLAELREQREAPGASPMLATPVRVVGAKAPNRQVERFAGLSSRDQLPPGPLSHFALCPILPLRRDAEAMPYLHLVAECATGTSERAAAVAQRLRRFAEAKMASFTEVSSPFPTRSPRGGVGRG